MAGSRVVVVFPMADGNAVRAARTVQELLECALVRCGLGMEVMATPEILGTEADARSAMFSDVLCGMVEAEHGKGARR